MFSFEYSLQSLSCTLLIAIYAIINSSVSTPLTTPLTTPLNAPLTTGTLASILPRPFLCYLSEPVNSNNNSNNIIMSTFVCLFVCAFDACMRMRVCVCVCTTHVCDMCFGYLNIRTCVCAVRRTVCVIVFVCTILFMFVLNHSFSILYGVQCTLYRYTIHYTLSYICTI